LVIEALEREGERAISSSEQREQLVELLHGLLADNERAELLLEARMDELSVVREVLAAISYPVIEVRRDVLCLAIVGPVDAQRMEQAAEAVLHAASSRRARWLIVDLTGAVIADSMAANLLHRLFAALRLLGVRGALSGVTTNLALILAEQPQPLDVPVHASLAQALAAAEQHHEVRS
jgi:anti-anti-sigma regulatory factor